MGRNLINLKTFSGYLLQYRMINATLDCISRVGSLSTNGENGLKISISIGLESFNRSGAPPRTPVTLLTCLRRVTPRRAPSEIEVAFAPSMQGKVFITAARLTLAIHLLLTIHSVERARF